MNPSLSTGAFDRNLAKVWELCSLTHELFADDLGVLHTGASSSNARPSPIIADSPDSEDDEEDVEFVLGPTAAAFSPYSVDFVRFPGISPSGEPVLHSVRSRSHVIYLSDVPHLILLGKLLGGRGALSFGSVVHFQQDGTPRAVLMDACEQHDRERWCRPCMFERRGRRCRKSWLCDFCHVHLQRTPRGTGRNALSRHAIEVGSANPLHRESRGRGLAPDSAAGFKKG